MNNEETKYWSNNETDETTEPTKTVLKTGWKRVAVGGVTGVLIGAAASYAASHIHSANDVEQVDAANDEQGTPEQLHADSVTDDMPFNEAFAAARTEVGPGGTFTWHGNVYGTFTADEWDALSSEDKVNYFNQINAHAPLAHDSTPQPQVVNVYHHVIEHEAARTATAQTEPSVEHAIDVSGETNTNDDVHAVGDVQVVTNTDGTLTYVQPIEAQGHAGLLMGDGPDGPDVAVIDIDDTSSLTANDVIIDLNSGQAATLGEVYAVVDVPEDPGFAEVDFESGFDDEPNVEDPYLSPMEDPMLDGTGSIDTMDMPDADLHAI